MYLRTTSHCSFVSSIPTFDQQLTDPASFWSVMRCVLDRDPRLRQQVAEALRVMNGEIAAAVDADVGGGAAIDRDLIGDERHQTTQRRHVGLGRGGDRAVGNECP